jgi:polyisoprenoid-binding protein YceI
MRTLPFAAMLLGALACATATASAQPRLVSQPGTKVTVDGSSNVHGWSCSTDSVEVTVAADPAIAKPGTPPRQAFERAQVRISVVALECGDGTMNKNLRKALAADANPAILFKSTGIEVNAGTDADHFTVIAAGALSIAGKEKPISIEIATTRLANGTFKAIGTVPLRMTDFGIKPPVALLGTLRTKDPVTVRFELILSAVGAVAPIDRIR